MIKTIFVFCATDVIRNAETNQISAINIFENVNSAGFPLLIPVLALIWSVKRDKADAQFITGTLSIKLDQEVLHELPFKFSFEESLVARQIVKIGGLVITRPGVLTMTFRAKNGPSATCEVIVSGAPLPDVKSDDTSTTVKDIRSRKKSLPKPRRMLSLKKALLSRRK